MGDKKNALAPRILQFVVERDSVSEQEIFDHFTKTDTEKKIKTALTNLKGVRKKLKRVVKSDGYHYQPLNDDMSTPTITTRKKIKLPKSPPSFKEKMSNDSDQVETNISSPSENKLQDIVKTLENALTANERAQLLADEITEIIEPLKEKIEELSTLLKF